MRATDLIGATVYDRDGRAVGPVRDLRLRAGDCVLSDSGRPAYQLESLQCGPAGAAHRLGYGHRPMNGPWPLTAIMRALLHRSVLVDWTDIVRIDGARIHIRRRRDELSSAVRRET